MHVPTLCSPFALTEKKIYIYGKMCREIDLLVNSSCFYLFFFFFHFLKLFACVMQCSCGWIVTGTMLIQ